MVSPVHVAPFQSLPAMIDLAAPPVPDQPFEGHVAGLREALAAGRHAAVLAVLPNLLSQAPANRDLLVAQAISLRHLRQTQAALAACARLIAAHPRFSLGHQEAGLCHIALRDAPAAIAALLRAVNLNPALPMAWRMLEGVYRLSGQPQDAATAAGHSAALARLPPPVLAATALYHDANKDGDLERAERDIRAFLLTYGDHPEAMRLLAKIGIAREVYDDAETLLAGVLAMAPGHRAARLEYAQTLTLRHRFVEAEAALAPLNADAGTKADTEADTEADTRAIRATIAVGLGRQAEAITLYRAMLADLPDAPASDDRLDVMGLAAARADINLWLGHALKTLGLREDAIAAYRTACAARPDFGDAWWSLANLKTYRFDAADIATMQAAQGAPTTAHIDRVHLNFALGKALEDSGDPAAAWPHYEAGNALQRDASAYRPEVIETNTAEQIRICTPAFFAARQGWGAPDPDPIFILGLPRSGSTLIEQILASHPDVEGTQELPDIQRIVIEMQGRDPDYDAPRYPAALADLTAAQARALGERYLADTRVHRAGGRARFIDKMPNNFRHIGLIQLILPNAKIIDARREPMACCFSNLKQLFAQGQEFTYAQDHIARYYRTYLELMRHWNAALPGRIHRVINEDVITDLEREVRALLAYCDLPFDPACLAFHQTARPVRTPSSEQVRRPVNRDGLDQWRPFEPYLTPLAETLGAARRNWRD